MQEINVPSYGYNRLLGNDAQIKAIMDVCDYLRRWKAEVDAHNDINNLSAILSLAMNPNSGITIDTTNPDYKIAWVDSQSNVLIGKSQNNSWYFADTLDNILDTIISNL